MGLTIPILSAGQYLKDCPRMRTIVRKRDCMTDEINEEMGGNEEDSSDLPVHAEDKQKLLEELKKRLKEIERLKHALGMTNLEKESPENEPATTSSPTDRVREELEELHVPPLELLEDTPMQKKKKPVDARV